MVVQVLLDWVVMMRRDRRGFHTRKNHFVLSGVSSGRFSTLFRCWFQLKKCVSDLFCDGCLPKGQAWLEKHFVIVGVVALVVVLLEVRGMGNQTNSKPFESIFVPLNSTQTVLLPCRF